MIEEVNERLREQADYALNGLRDLGFEVESSPEFVFSTHIPGDRIASYDPKKDIVYVSQDPENLSEAEYSELATALQKQVMRSESLDDSQMNELTETYWNARRLEEEAKLPLDELFSTIKDYLIEEKDQEKGLLPLSIEKYRDRLENGNREALERLVDEERNSTLDEYIEEIGINEKEEFYREIEFYKKLLDENYEQIVAGLELQQNIEMLMRYQMDKSNMAEEKVDHSASLLLGPLKNGEIEDITGRQQERFIDNLDTEDNDIEQITSEILTSMRTEEGKSTQERFRGAVEKTREFWE